MMKHQTMKMHRHLVLPPKHKSKHVIPQTTAISNIKLPILKKEEKAKNILLMAIPKEHMRRFHGMDDAKEIWEAIKTSSEVRKDIDSFQQLLFQLEAHGAEVSTEDANHKFLRSLPPTWSNLAMTIRTKPDVDTLSIDDLYNNLRVFEQEIQVSCISFDFINLVLHEKEALAGFADEFYKKTGRRVCVDGKTPVGFDKKKLECFNCHNTGHFHRKVIKGGHMMERRRETLFINTKKLESKRRIRWACDNGCWVLSIGREHTEMRRNKPCTYGFQLLLCSTSLSWDYYSITTRRKLLSSLYVYGKKGPQEPEPSVSDDRSSEYSTCQSNDSAGSIGTSSEHSVDPESEISRVPQEVYVSNPITTNEKGVSASKSKEVEPSCVSHIKTPRQQIKNQETPKVNRKNWNAMMERELGEGYSFTKKKCFVCGSLSHLIKDCDYYENKMARETIPKKQMVLNTGNWVAKPVWTNDDRINHANQFVPRPVQLNAGRTNINSVRPNINTGRTNINSVRPRVNTVNSTFNTVRSRQPVPTRTSNSFSPKRPQVNQFHQKRHFSKSYSPVRRPIDRNTAKMSYFNAVKGKRGTAVKTSAGYNWRNSNPNSNCDSGPTFIRTVITKGSSTVGTLVDRGIFDSGMLRAHAGNKDKLVYFERIQVELLLWNVVGFSFCASKDGNKWDSSEFIRQIDNQLIIGNKTREYSNARKSTANGVAERMNKTSLRWACLRLNYHANDLMNSYSWIQYSNSSSNPHADNEIYKYLQSTNSAGTSQTPNSDASKEKDEDAEFIIMPSAVKNTEEKVDTRKRPLPGKQTLPHTPSVNSGNEPVNTGRLDPDDSPMPELKIFHKSETGIFDEASYDEEGVVTDFNSLPTEIEEEPKKISEALQDDSWVQAMQKELLQFKDCKQLLGSCWNFPHGMKMTRVYVSQPPDFVDPDPIRRDKKDIMLVQVYVGDIIFGSTKKSWCDELKLDESIFQLSYYGVKTAITPMETKVALTKDEEVVDVDVHLYRSMIGSLMYLTASRPDIMFAVCACSRFHVTSKTSHLNVVKRIFKYLKGKPNLGLWYPRESPFDLEAFSDSDYGGSNLDRKSTNRTFAQTDESAGFAKIVDFLRGSNLEYALTTNSTIYDSLVKQFWQTATAKTLADGTLELHTTIDTIAYTITGASIRTATILPLSQPAPPTPIADTTKASPSPTPLPAHELMEHTFEQPSSDQQPPTPRQEATTSQLLTRIDDLLSSSGKPTTLGMLSLTLVKVTSFGGRFEEKDKEGSFCLILKRKKQRSGRKFHDLDPLVSLLQELVTPSKTPSKTINASGEEQVEDISPTTLEAVAILTKVKKIKSVDKGKRYKRNKSSKEFAGTGLDFES
ncbi:hypothetical protein Tco_1210515 [Tanacetum coccineum]